MLTLSLFDLNSKSFKVDETQNGLLIIGVVAVKN